MQCQCDVEGTCGVVKAGGGLESSDLEISKDKQELNKDLHRVLKIEKWRYRDK